jgi:hypothetical protein
MPMTDEQLRAFGTLVVNYGAVEVAAMLTLSGFVSDDQTTSRVVVADEGLPWKLDKTRTFLALRLEPDDKARVLTEAWLADAKAFHERRNTLLHSSWLDSDDPNLLQRVKFTAKRGRLKDGFEEVPLGELRAAADEGRRVADANGPVIEALARTGVWATTYYRPRQ